VKVFFGHPSSNWAKESGYVREWDDYVAKLKSDDPLHSITDNPKIADVIIHPSNEQIGTSGVSAQLRLLSNEDVRHFVWDWGDRPTGRMSGFYCSLERSLFDHDRHRTVHYPVPFNEFVEEFPQEDAVYNFGFVGGLTAGLRNRLFLTLKPTENKNNSNIKRQGIDFSRVFERGESPIKRDYVEFLRKTRFILCPRGYGLGTVRLFEAMKAGRVPVIISDRYTLPKGIDWTNCSIRVTEREIDRIPEILQPHLQNWPAMARSARRNWEDNFSDSRFFGYLTKNLEEILDSLPRVTRGLQFRYAVGIASQLTADRLRPIAGRLRERLTGRAGA
jgi:hypothetical protein